MSEKTWRDCSISRAAVAALSIATVHAAGVGHAFAGHDTQTAALSQGAGRLALLEEAFWRCDYAATVRGVDATPLEFCSAVYGAVKDEKFGGSFEDLLGWWTANKKREHGNLAGE